MLCKLHQHLPGIIFPDHHSKYRLFERGPYFAREMNYVGEVAVVRVWA